MKQAFQQKLLCITKGIFLCGFRTQTIRNNSIIKTNINHER